MSSCSSGWCTCPWTCTRPRPASCCAPPSLAPLLPPTTWDRAALGSWLVERPTLQDQGGDLVGGRAGQEPGEQLEAHGPGLGGRSRSLVSRPPAPASPPATTVWPMAILDDVHS